MKGCSTCQLQTPQKIVAPLKPILASGFMSQLHDDSLQWILHAIDH